jgi:putative transposase
VLDASTSPFKERYAVSNDNVVKLIQPGAFEDQLTEILRQGARSLLGQAVEAEVADFLAKYAELKTDDGRRRVVRHGHLPEREVMTGIGPVAVRQPRVRDRAAAAEDPGRICFTPAILPPYMRRSKSIETLLPILYLKGRPAISPRRSLPCSARTQRGCRQPPLAASRMAGSTSTTLGRNAICR